MLTYIFVIFLASSQVLSDRNKSVHAFEERTYELRRTSGPGCPYTASWLAHINLFRRLWWKLNNTKMEAISFEIFHKSEHSYQLEDDNAYYVHHMSLFEHELHKKSGFQVAAEKTFQMSMAAYEVSCQWWKRDKDYT